MVCCAICNLHTLISCASSISVYSLNNYVCDHPAPVGGMEEGEWDEEGRLGGGQRLPRTPHLLPAHTPTTHCAPHCIPRRYTPLHRTAQHFSPAARAVSSSGLWNILLLCYSYVPYLSVTVLGWRSGAHYLRLTCCTKTLLWLRSHTASCIISHMTYGWLVGLRFCMPPAAACPACTPCRATHTTARTCTACRCTRATHFCHLLPACLRTAPCLPHARIHNAVTNVRVDGSANSACVAWNMLRAYGGDTYQADATT